MTMNKRPYKSSGEEIKLTLDARKRISLAKLLSSNEVCSFRAYTEGDKIILEPMMEIPAREVWLYKNSKAYDSVVRGMDQAQKGKTRKLKRDFSKYIDDEI